ncbi:MAG: hypothetical protein KZQ70_15755, partial [gamma proteobacterium symbiont of Lucinoma myriamae]|nr:hypothetical protein [gamma proteobacterium symbiont of Lucinoma myriamae]
LNLNAFFEYSKIWKLDVNFSKTKVLIFGTRNDDRFDFKLGENKITICKDFKYLGITFTKSRSFCKAIKHNVDQAKKAMHLLFKRIRNLHLPIDLQLHLFDHTIIPIALYGCEVWGYENTQIIENLHNEFLRKITSLRKSTPIYMLHSELGRRPIQLNIKNRMIGYWISIINGKDSKLSKLLYKVLLQEFSAGVYEHKWIKCIKDILISVGRLDLFEKEIISNANSVKLSISKTLTDLNVQEWNAKLNLSSKGRTYSIFKHEINLEQYLVNLPKSDYLKLIRFRLSNHKLPVEKGRWDDIPLNERKCSKCDKNDIGDEFHYLFTCSYFDTERKQFLKPYFYKRPNIIKFKELLSSNNVTLLKKLSKFVDIIMETFL